MRHLSQILIIVLLSSISVQVSAQIEVSSATQPPYTPNNLIENVFLGSGVEVTDIQFEGNPAAVGYFNNAQADIAINRGIVMSTGQVSQIPNAASQFISTIYGSAITDPDVDSIATHPIRADIVKYTIKFIPTSDTLRFRYVFASEEYPEFVCDDFNDVFGFFMSGPGISGPYENNAENIALVPNTNIPVSINNVNNGNPNDVTCIPQNPQYYLDNSTGSNLAFDAFLKVFTAERIVTPCEEYTIKLVLADIGDGRFDTGVFLEAKSFGTGALNVAAATVSLDGSIVEGCTPATLSFNLPNPVDQDFYLDYTIFGNATPGIDYTTIPGGLFIPAGDSVVSVVVQAFEDNLVEGIDTVAIDIQKDICGRDTFYFFIREKVIVPPDLPMDTTFCTGGDLLLDGTLPVPEPDPPIFYSSGETAIPTNSAAFSDISVFGVQPFNLKDGVIKQICIDSLSHRWLSDVDIYLVAPNGQFIELTTDNGGNGGNGTDLDYYLRTCFTPGATTPINFPGPVAPASAVPFTGEWLPEGVWSDLWDGGEAPTNGTWSLQLIDDSNGLDGTLHSWSICFEPLYSIDYAWDSDLGLSCYDCPNPVANPDQTTTYVLTATDSYGCEVQDSITISVEEALPAPVINCADESDTYITVEWQDLAGSSGYEVSTDGGMTWITVTAGDLDYTVNNLSTNDSVTVYVRGISDCMGAIDSVTCRTTTCAPYGSTVTNIEHVNCNGGSDGTVTILASGGLAPHMYTLNGETNSTGVFTGLEAGLYPLLISDGLDCPSLDTIEIFEPLPMIGSTILIDSVQCFGEMTGSATIQISGGVGPYQFDWSNSSQDSIAINLGSGSIDVIVTDANLCEFPASIVIPEYTVLGGTTSFEEPDCYGESSGSATVMGSGGNGPYNYEWTPMTTSPNTNATYDNIPAGNYTVTINDDNNCSTTRMVMITEPDSLMLTLTADSVGCAGEANGLVNSMVTGGSGAGTYQYNWTGPTSGSGAQISSAAAGTYNLEVVDGNLCRVTGMVTVGEPSPILLTIDSSNVSCNGNNDGTITATAVGGTGTIDFNWSNAQSGTTITNLPADTYIVTALDEENCSIQRTIVISEPTAITIDPMVNNVACDNGSDGSISITINGGAPGYSFSWIGPNGFNSIQQDIANLEAGDYIINLLDQNNCPQTLTIPVTANAPIISNVQSTDVSCFGLTDGTISLSTSGGTPPFQFMWDNGLDPTESQLGLSPGNYNVTILDINNCEIYQSATINEPPPMITTYDSTNITCHNAKDGQLFFTTTGGSAPYNYSLDGSFFSPNEEWYNLGGGDYDVIILDNQGCTDTLPVFVEEPALIEIDLGENQLITLGDTTSIISIVTNGVGNLTYSWSPSDPALISCSDCPNPTITVDDNTIFTLTVTDENGCVEQQLVRIVVERMFGIHVPTAFTPNDDNMNDLLVVHGSLNARIILYRVYDRWGELVYQETDFISNDKDIGWNGNFKGRPMNPGVYIWTVEAEFEDGSKDLFKGHTTLIR